MNRIKSFCTVALTTAICCSAAGIRAELANGIKAIVSDSIITYQQVEMFTMQGEQFLRDRYGTQSPEYKKGLQSLLNTSLETLVQRKLILHDFKSSGFNVPETLIDEIVQERIRDRYKDRMELTKRLQSEGMTFEKFRQDVRDRFIEEQMTAKFIPEPIISPHKIEVYYQDHQTAFKVEDQVKLRLILLNRTGDDKDESTKKRAEELVSQLKDGASFEELAKSYSEGSTRAQGGQTDWQDVSVVNKALVEPISKLKSGEYTAVIETPQVYFIVKLEDRHPAHVKPLNEVRNEVERTLIGQEVTRLQEAWVKRLTKKTFVRYF
jgi:peptidyl-prolyl cis-trans isomerase SurA